MRSKINIVLAFALISVSMSSILARFLPSVSAVVISFWRMAIASLLIWFYTVFIRQKLINKKNYKYYILSGLFLALHFTCFYGAVKLTSIANATLLGISAPVFTILFERFIVKRPLRPLVLLGFIFALCGTLIISGSGVVINDGAWIGKLLGLIAALCIAVVYIFAEKLRSESNTIVYTRSLYSVAVIFLFIFSFLGGENVFSVKPDQILWLIMLGLVPTILGHSLFYYVIKYTSPTIVASVPIGEPIIASVLAWLIFLERVPLITLIAGVFILCGVYLIVYNSPKAYLSDNY